MRLALFGGTFDPIHCGHLRVARAAADAFSLDRILLAPVGRQPLKSAPASASFEDRLAMATLALVHPCADNEIPDPRLTVTSLDAPRPDGQPNFTVDLLAELSRTNSHAALFAIAGADSFLTLAQWRSPDRVLELAQWIVVSRPGLDMTSAFLDRPEFAPLALNAEQRTRVHLLPGIHEDISATAVRQALRDRRDDIHPKLSPAVTTYIRNHDLYR